MSDTTYRIPDPPEFTPAQVHAWWSMDTTTHMAMGFCPQHGRNMLPAQLDYEYGLPPSCNKCGTWLQTLEVVEVQHAACPR